MFSLKKLLCFHVLKKDKTEFLEKKWEHISQAAVLNDMRKAYFNHYAHHMECIKCGKTKIETTRKWANKEKYLKEKENV
jgi:hypothetical protein